MNYLGAVIGIAIAVGLGAWFWRSKKPVTPRGRTLQALIVLMATAAGVAGAHYGLEMLEDGPNGPLSVDRTLEELKQAPLIRLVLADVPGAEARIRKALEEDRQQPVARGTTRAFIVMSELRAGYIVPALKAADDKTALAAVAARTAVLRQLQSTSLALCREFAVTGIRRVDTLDAKSQELFRATLAALEEAYRSGRNTGGAAPSIPTDRQTTALLTEAGFQPLDFENIQKLDALPDAEACALAARINGAPTQVAADKGGGLARYLLSNQ